ncbi:MAG: hypothetical protein MUO43_09235 [Desulfobacterales bacterium]|nr:hypothetical protein [Desulfobacterales bacterium]
MKVINELSKLHEEITSQIIEENNREMAESISAKRAATAAAEKSYQDELKAFEALGLNVANLEALDRERSGVANKELLDIEAQMDDLSKMPSSCPEREIDVDGSFLPPDTLKLTPSWTATFSDDDVQDSLTDASAIEAQLTVGGGSCKDYYNWASGGGWGCTGGVGSIDSYVEWGFWFRPSTSRFYSIRPFFRFRGYYIVRADDKWYNCKFARVVMSAQTNCYQYNWKGWNSVDVLNVGDDNINVNKRFDDDRYTYNSYLLGGGDWAYVRARIKLYAYAKGSGSYAKNDYSTGAANYLCVPSVLVY